MAYIKGEKNIGADAFSRMRFANSEGPSINDEVFTLNTTPECVMHGPIIYQHQENDEMIASIKAACLAGTNNPDNQLQVLLGCTMVGYKHRVIVPYSLRDDLIDWYHMNLGHPASHRQHKTMQSTFYWPHMATTIDKFVRKCIKCKR